jgi:S1-C subfamily serine protease
LLTSASLFKEQSDLIDVEIGEVHVRARLVGMEPTVDLAVLSVDAPVPLQPATLADSDRVRVGQWAIAVGDPPGAARFFSPGTIAARPERDCYQEHRTSTLLQSSAVLAPEGYGGPLVDLRGEVVGLTVPGPGGASALPMNLVGTLYRALKVKESSRSPWIGISVLDLSAALRRRLPSAPLTGIYIDDVFEPSPASRAGIRAGDVLTRMDDHRIFAVSDFQRWLYLLGIDASVRLEIFREGKTLLLDIPIEQRPPSATMR